MTSKEVELELRLTQLNNKILFYCKLIKIKPMGFRLFGMAKRIQKVTELRNECFKELRELLRKKYPEKFIRSEGSNG